MRARVFRLPAADRRLLAEYRADFWGKAELLREWLYKE